MSATEALRPESPELTLDPAKSLQAIMDGYTGKIKADRNNLEEFRKNGFDDEIFGLFMKIFEEDIKNKRFSASFVKLKLFKEFYLGTESDVFNNIDQSINSILVKLINEKISNQNWQFLQDLIQGLDVKSLPESVFYPLSMSTIKKGIKNLLQEKNDTEQAIIKIAILNSGLLTVQDLDRLL